MSGEEKIKQENMKKKQPDIITCLKKKKIRKENTGETDITQ